MNNSQLTCLIQRSRKYDCFIGGTLVLYFHSRQTEVTDFLLFSSGESRHHVQVRELQISSSGGFDSEVIINLVLMFNSEQIGLFL